MKRKRLIAVSVITGIGLACTQALSQGPTPATTPLDPNSIASSFKDWAFWITLLATIVSGALGGIAFELMVLQGNIEMPHKYTSQETEEKFPYAISRYLYDLGFVARIIIGALAAVAAWVVLSPQTAFSLLATAIVAGSAGTSILRSLQDRLLAAIAVKEAAETKAKAVQQNSKVEEAMKAYSGLKRELMTAAESPAGARELTLKGGAGLSLDLDELDKIDRLFSEAKGIHEGI
jgi:hypothetical protein